MSLGAPCDRHRRRGLPTQQPDDGRPNHGVERVRRRPTQPSSSTPLFSVMTAAPTERVLVRGHADRSPRSRRALLWFPPLDTRPLSLLTTASLPLSLPVPAAPQAWTSRLRLRSEPGRTASPSLAASRAVRPESLPPFVGRRIAPRVRLRPRRRRWLLRDGRRNARSAWRFVPAQ